MFQLRSERMLPHSPRAFPWEQDLPWALARLLKIITAGPESADRASENACVKGAVVGTERATGTSATAKIRSACGAFVAGRRRGARPSVARMMMSEPSTPRQRRIAVSESSLRPRRLRASKPHPPRGHASQFFFASGLRSAGVLQSPQEIGPQPSALLLRRLPSSRP